MTTAKTNQPYRAAISRTIATVHLGFGVMALTVYLGIYLTGSTLPLVSKGFVFTLLFTLSALAQRSYRPRQRRTVWAVAALDILLFTCVIMSFASLYGGMSAAALKAPTYNFIFVLLALQALRADPRLLLFLGGVAIGARLVLFLAVVQSGAATTISYTWYQSSASLMYSGEGEILLSLLLFSVVMAAVLKRRPIKEMLSGPVGEAQAPQEELPVTNADDSSLDRGEQGNSTDGSVSPQEAETRPVTTMMAAQPTRVLIAEDSQVNMMVLEKMLAAPDFELTMAEDGQEVIDLFGRLVDEGRRPDVALMDIEMPLLNGHEAAESIRAMEKDKGLPPLPIIAVTALGHEADIERSRESGMDDHLVKPVKKEELLTAITKALARSARD